jgi:tetratricopeptide (TPR) repeat protein
MTRRRALTIAGLALVVCGAAVLAVRGWHALRCGWLRQTCRQARDAGNWDALERSALAWAGLEPRSADPLLFAAEAAVARRAIDTAAAHLDRVPDDDPKAVAALLHRVDMLFGELGRPEEAAETCRRVLAIDPACGPAHQRLTFYYAVTLQRTRVAAQARAAIAAGGDIPETYVYLVGADWLTLSNTTAVSDQWLKSNPDDERLLVAAARGDVAARGLDDALDSDGPATEEAASVPPAHETRLRSLFRRFPSNPELLAFFLQQASTAGDIDEVARLLARVPATSRDDNRFWRFKAWLHDARGEMAAADEALAAALRLNPFDHASRHLLADVRRKAGRSADAAREAALAAEGRSLRRLILEQTDVATVQPVVLDRLQRFILGCGDEEMAGCLARRITGGQR